MADETISTEIVLTGADQVEVQLNKIGTAGEQAFKKIEDSSKSAGKAGFEKVEKGAGTASKSLEKLAESAGRVPGPIGSAARGLSSLTGSLRTVGLAAAAVTTAVALAGAGILKLASNAAEATSALRDAAIASGTSIENFQNFAFAAEQSGAKAADMQRAFTQIADAATQASEAGERSAAGFKELGIELIGADGKIRDTSAVLADLAKKIQQADTPSEQLGIAVQALGRRVGPQLVQALREGQAGLAAFAADLARLGGPITAVEAQVGEDLSDAFNRLGTAAGLLSTRLGLAFAPALTRIINGIADAVGRIAVAVQPAIDALARFADAGVTALSEAFSKLSKSIGDSKVFQGFVELVTAIANLINATVIPALQGLGLAIDAVSSALESLRAAVQETFGIDLANLPLFASFRGVVPQFEALGQVFSIVAAGVQLLADGFNAFGEILGRLRPLIDGFISSLSSITAPEIDFSVILTEAQAVFDQVVAAAQSTVAAIVQFFSSIPAALSSIWQAVVAAAQSAWNSVVQSAQNVANNIAARLQPLVTIWDAIRAAATRVWDAIRSAAETALSGVIAIFERVKSVIDSIVEAARAAAAALASIGVGAAGGGGFAGGGAVHGPGTSTSDSIPARLSRGEWVIKAAAVRKYGHALFYLLNSMRLPAKRLREMLHGFKDGGFAAGPMFRPIPVPLRMAEGGAVTEALAPVTLNIHGQEFEGLLAPRDVAERLERWAVNAKVRSGGQKPGWYR